MSAPRSPRRPFPDAWRRLKSVCALAAFLSVLLDQPPSAVAAPPTASELEFFEKQIRPILATHCLGCHSPQRKISSGLRLDSASGWLTGGDSGPAVVPGKPADSLLIQAVRYEEGAVSMPPAGKLPAELIEHLEAWVARGAPAPADEGGDAHRRPIDLDSGRQFWAYQPVSDSPTPTVQTGNWPLTAIDSFVLAKLEAANMLPNPPASPAVLIRRLYFDLVGLPPSADQVTEFAAAPDPQAYAKLVDRLLASPQFGERWARHWLDLVRYAESLTLRGFILPESWRYRDYVIDTFQQDRPYDQFLREQIAGDLLEAESLDQRQRHLVATTFLTLGNTNLEEQDKRQLDMDVVDEQLDVIGKAILGQTLGCARCHDHKFDPIPQRDYYALAGILRNAKLLDHDNVSRWTELPLPLPPDLEARHRQHEEAVAQVAEQLRQARDRVARLAGRGSDQVIAVGDLPGIVVDDTAARRVGEWKQSQHTRPYIGDGYLHDLDQGKGEKTLTFAPQLPTDDVYEIRLAYTPGANRAASVPVTVFSAEGEKVVTINMQKPPALEGRFVSLGEFRCEKSGQSFVLVSTAGTVGHVVADAVQYLPRRAPEDAAVKRDESERSNEQEQAAADVKRLERELSALQSALPPRPRVMTVVERPEIRDLEIHLRGSVHTLGEVVPRGFLRVVEPEQTTPFPASQSGRRELADWLASRANPLTSRVFVNRAWHWLIGQGLVRSVDNFGSTGEPPSHPELLDHLAARFIDSGWSVKSLVRSIVLSQTYRQSTAADELRLRHDPDNRWLWRAQRRRLDAECLRDALLCLSGELEFRGGGPRIRPGTTADYDYVDAGSSRSVYVPVLRNALPDLFEVFDFADPSLVVGQRNRSTVAPQALFLLNHPFVRERAAAAARLWLAQIPLDDEKRLDQAFLATVGRLPRDAERALAQRTLQDTLQASGSPERAWTELAHLLFSSLDFRYCD